MQRASLFRQTAGTLALGIIALQVFSLLTIILTVLYPLGQRSAEDLAGLLIMTAQTYAQLPKDQRPAFLQRVARDNSIHLGPPPRDFDLSSNRSHLYGKILAVELRRRLDRTVPVFTAHDPKGTLWVAIPVEGQAVWMHFARRRLTGTLPLGLIFILGVSTLALLVLTIILVRRVLRPLAVLADALRRKWNAPLPTLPASGAKEFYDLLDAFERMRTRLQAMIDHQSLLLVGISHDLRSPLARIQMALELLPEDTPQELREGMAEDTQRMTDLLAQSLAIGRGSSARIADLDLVALLRVVGEAYTRAGGDWHAQLPRRYPFRGDYEALRRLFDNLLDNVRRYAGERVDVRLYKRDGRGILQFCDAGPGIPEDRLEALLEPFSRGDSARGHSEGSGLGLAIARQIAEAQGLQLRLYNRGNPPGLCAELSWELRAKPRSRKLDAQASSWRLSARSARVRRSAKR